MAGDSSPSAKTAPRGPVVSPFFIKASKLIEGGVLQRPTSSGIDPASGFTFASATPFKPNLFGRNAVKPSPESKASQAYSDQNDENCDVDEDDHFIDLVSEVEHAHAPEGVAELCRTTERPAQPLPRPDPHFEQAAATNTPQAIQHVRVLSDSDTIAATEPNSDSVPTNEDKPSSGERGTDPTAVDPQQCNYKPQNPHLPNDFEVGASHQGIPDADEAQAVDPVLTIHDDARESRLSPTDRQNCGTTDTLPALAPDSLLEAEGNVENDGTGEQMARRSRQTDRETVTPQKRSKKRESVDPNTVAYQQLSYEQLLEALELKRKDAATSNVRKYQTMVKRFEEALANASKDLAESENISQRLQAELSKERVRAKEVKDELEQLKSQNATLEHSNTDLLAKESEARNASRRKSKEHHLTLAQLKKSNRERERLQHDLQQANCRTEAFVSDISHLKDNETAMRHELATLDTLRRGLDRQLGEKSAMLTEERDGKLHVSQQLDKALLRYWELDKRMDDMKTEIVTGIGSNAVDLQQRQNEAQDRAMCALEQRFTTLKDELTAAVSRIEPVSDLVQSHAFRSEQAHVENMALGERILRTHESTSSQLQLSTENLQSMLKSEQALSGALEKSQSRCGELQKQVEAAVTKTCSWTAKYNNELRRAERAEGEVTQLNSSLQQVFGWRDEKQPLDAFLKQRMDELAKKKPAYVSRAVQTETESKPGEPRASEAAVILGESGSSVKHSLTPSTGEAEGGPAKRQKRTPRAKKKG